MNRRTASDLFSAQMMGLAAAQHYTLFILCDYIVPLAGPHEAPVSQGGDQRLLQAQQQASRNGQPLQSSPMGFQCPPVSQHGAPASNQGLVPPTQNAQSQQMHLPPHHLQSTPPQSNQGSSPWAPTPPTSHPLSSPPLTPQKVPHIQVSLCKIKRFDVVASLRVCVCDRDQNYVHLFSCVGVFHLNVYFSCGWGNVCV